MLEVLFSPAAMNSLGASASNVLNTADIPLAETPGKVKLVYYLYIVALVITLQELLYSFL